MFTSSRNIGGGWKTDLVVNNRYRVDPLLSEHRDGKTEARYLAEQAEKYKAVKMKILMEMHKTKPNLVPLNASGEPIW